MRSKRTYALWLVPEGTAYERLRLIIEALSLRYASPVFKPHITLVGGIGGQEQSLKELLLQTARSAEPFEVDLGELQHLDEFYRCLFVRVREAEAVMQFHALAKRVFRKRDRQVFMPHVSLLYAELPRSEKEHLIADLGKEWDVRVAVRSVHLYATTGTPDMWYQVCSHPLGAPRTCTHRPCTLISKRRNNA